jgi:glutamine synthetase
MVLGSAASFCSYLISSTERRSWNITSLGSGWDIQDVLYSKELSIANQANGFRDVLASIDLSTYRRIPWEGNVPFFLVSFFDPNTKQPLSVDPRGRLKTTTERAAMIGRECIAGIEYEVITSHSLYPGFIQNMVRTVL